MTGGKGAVTQRAHDMTRSNTGGSCLWLAVQRPSLVQAMAARHRRRDAHVRQDDLPLVVDQDVAGLHGVGHTVNVADSGQLCRRQIQYVWLWRRAQPVAQRWSCIGKSFAGETNAKSFVSRP